MSLLINTIVQFLVQFKNLSTSEYQNIFYSTQIVLYHLYGKKFLLPIADPSKTLVSLRGVFCSSPLGNLLKPVFEDEVIKNEATMNYMNDFLHMMYKPMVESELQVNVIILGRVYN